MHRILKVTNKGYIICEDKRTHPEKDITDKDIIGVFAAFCLNGKFIKCTDEDYIRYAKKVCCNLPMRIIKNLIKRIFRKLYRIPKRLYCKGIHR